MATIQKKALVIGAGTGGYPCAIRLGQLGVDAMLVEKDKPGGVCLNWGCIPSKALISATKLYHKAQHVSEMGLKFGSPTVDMIQMQAWKSGIVKKLTGGVQALVKGAGTQYVKATAEFRLDGQPLLWFAADKSKAVLDERVFGELTMVNVTTLGEGKTAVVGKIKEPGRTLAPRAVAWFLMRSGILQTFVHLEANVKLEGEKTAGGRYEAAFSGKHLYYTNERHESAFRFRFIIEADGTLRVES